MSNPVQTVTISQALTSTASGLLVLDTGANIANALPNSALTSRVVSFTLSSSATLSAAQTLKLAGLGAKFQTGGNVLALSDTLATIDAAGNAAAVSLANIVVASDTAANLLAASAQNLAHVSAAAMTGSATVTLAQLTHLEALPYFQLAAGARLTVADTATNISSLLLAHPAWLAQVTGITVQLDGSVMLAGLATELSNLMAAGTALNFTSSGANTTLHVTGVATNLALDATALNRLNNLVTKVVTVANPGATVTVAQAQALEGIAGLTLSGGALVLADTGAAISQNASAVFGQGFAQIQVTSGTLVGTASQLLAAGLTFQAGAKAQLNASFVASTTQAASLAALPSFSLASGVSLTVAGPASTLAANAAAWAAAASNVQVTASAMLNAADATSLENIARQFGARFSLSGHTITIADTGHNLAALSAATIGLASGFVLSAAGNVSVADLSALRSLTNFSLNGQALTVADTAANLLTLSSASPATATQLSANASGLSAGQFTALSHLPGFSAGGFSLGIADTAANLLGLASANLSQVSSITLSANATVSASVANQLAAEHGFAAGTFGLTVQDTAANLLTLSTAAKAVAAAEILPAGHVTLNAAVAEGLAALPHFSTTGAAITVSDTLANLGANSTWALVAGAYDVVDTASNLAAAENAGGVPATLLHGAAAVTLSAPASGVSAATVAALAGIPAFATDGTALAVSDTAANLAANAVAVRELASSVALSGPATISLSQAAALAGIAGAFGSAFSRGGYTLTLAGTPTDILSVTQAEAALIGAYELSAAATVTVQTFTSLRALPQFSDNGFALALADTAANLLAFTGSSSLVTATNLTANATLTAAQYLALASLPGLSANGHVLTVLDTAAQLATLQNANLSPVSVTELSASAVMNAAQANIVTGAPGYSDNGFTVTISDTAANLFTLSHAAQVAATAIALSANSTVTAAQLTQLAAFGVKFFTDGYSLTVADTAAHLASLSLAAIGLSTAEQINASGSVNASVAGTLAALPNLSLAQGVTLTVQDSAANLLALGTGAPASTTSEILTPGPVTLSAAQAAGLAALPHFSAAGATITVSDSVANLTAQANTGWSGIAAATDVVDSAANLAGAAGTNLVQHATLATLSGNAVISASQAALISTIPHYSAGSYVLQVSDTAAAIANAASAVAAVAGQVVLASSGTVNAAQADALAGIGTLSFAHGVRLTVQDSFANLTNTANETGMALASLIKVVDSAGNLITASAYDWGGLSPSYMLSQGGTITAAQAVTLAALGSHYANGGYTLAVSDGASAVAAAAAALQSLGITASVTDTAAAIGAAATGLVALGARLISVTATDTAPVTASVAAALSGLAGKLVNTVLTVNDSAAAIAQYQSALSALGVHANIHVTDTGAYLVANAAAVEALATQVTLGDSPVFSSANLAIYAQVLAALGSNFVANGHSVTLQDSEANIVQRTAAQLALAASVVVTGSISLAQATALETAGLAAKLSGALSVLDSSQNLVADLTGGSVLSALLAGSAAIAVSVTGGTLSLTFSNATAILGSQAARALMGDLVPATVVSVSGVSAAGFAAVAGSGWPHLAVTVVDSTADIGSAASAITQALQHFTGQLTISLTDTGAVGAAAAAALQPFATYLAGNTALAVTDSAADIAQYASALTALGSAIGTITLTSTAMDAATVAAIAPLDSHLASGVRLSVTDTAANIDANHVQLAQLNTDGHLASVTVQNASVADIVAHRSAIDALPSHLVIRDSAANIAADLTGGASVLSAESAKITSVTLSAGGVVGAAALRDMAALPGFSLGSATLAVSDTASAIDTLTSGVLGLARTATIVDSAANVGSAAQAILAALTGYTGTTSITLTDTAPVSAQTAASLAAVASLLAQGTSLNVSDSASDVATYAAGLGTLGAALGTISLQGVAMNAATAAPLANLAAHLGQGVLLNVTDSSHNIAQNLTALETLSADQHLGTVTVSGESVATISPNIAALNSVSAQVTVSDTGADVVAALATLAGIHHLVSITLTDHSAPTLTMSLATLQSESGVLAKIASSYTLQILDTAANIQNDIVSGNSGLIASTSDMAAVAVSDGGTVSLSQSQLLNSDIGSTVQFTGALGVSAVDVADLAQVASRGATSIAVSDLAANITSDLTSGASVLAAQARLGTLASVTSTSGTHITLSAAQAEAAGVDDSAHSVIALLSGATLTISGAAVADFSALSGLHTAPASIAVADTSANIANDLVSGHSALAASGLVSVVSVTGGTLSLTGAQAHTILQTPSLIAMVGVITAHNALSVSGAALADAHAIFAGEGWSSVTMTVAESAADLANNQSELPLSSQVSVVVTDGAAAIGAQASGLSYLSSNSVAFSISLTDSIPVSAAAAASLGVWASHLATGTLIGVSDSAADIGANAANLALLGSKLGTITLTGTALDAADAAGLATLAAHLGQGVTVSVTDTAAQIAANVTNLTSLQNAGKLGTVAVSGGSVSDVTAHVSALNTIGASVTISDSAQNIAAGLATLASVTGLGTIAATGGSTINVSWTIQQLAADHAVLGKISGAYALTITDSASDIEADLALGSGSVLRSYGALLSGVTVTGGNPVYLTASQILAPGIDTGASSALAHFSGTLDATSASVSQIASLLNEQTVPTSIAVSDTAQHIAADLASGTASSKLLLNAAKIGSITVSDGGAISLTASQALAAGVDDSGSSALAKISGMSSFTVTGVAVSQLASVLALNVVPVIDISDTAANIEGGIATLAADRAHIGAIAQSDGATFTMTAAQALTAGVADGAGSVLALMGNPVYDVTGAQVSQISALQSLASGAPTQITVSDTSQNILAAIINGGSALAQEYDTYHRLGTVTVTGGVLTATADQIASAAANGTGSIGILGLLANGTTIDIQGVTVGDITSLLAYGWSGTRLEITDTASSLATDLTGGTSVLQAHSGVIGSVTLTAGGTVTAAALAAMYALPSFSESTFTLAVGDNAANLASMSHSLLGLIDAITVTDSASNVGAHAAALLSLANALTGSFVISLNDTQPVAATVAAGLQTVDSLLQNSTVLAVSDTAGAIAGNVAGLEALSSRLGTVSVTDATVSAANAATISALASHLGAGLTVADSAGAVTTNLAGLQTLQNAGKLAAVDVTGAAVADVLANLTALNDVNAQVSVSDSAGNVAGGLATLAELANLHAIALTGGGTQTLAGLNVNALTTYAAVLGTIGTAYNIAVSDTAGDIQSDLESNSSVLASNTHLASITVSDSGTVMLTQQELLASAIGNGVTFSGTLAVTGVDMADLAAVAARTPSSISVVDHTIFIQTDLASGSSLLASLANENLLSGVQGDTGTIHLSASAIEVAGVDDNAHSVAARLSNATLAVTGAHVSDLETLAHLYEVPSIAMQDSSGAIVTDLLLGAGSQLAMYVSDIGIINVTGGTITLSSAQALALAGGVAADAGNWTAIENLFASGTELSVTGVLIQDAMTVETLSAGTIAGISIAIADSAQNIVNDLAGSDVLGMLQSGSELASVTLNQDGTVTAAQLVQMSELTGFSNGGHGLGVTGNAAGIAGLTASQTALTSSVTITDTAGGIGLHLSGLQTALQNYAHGVTLDLTDSSGVSADTAAALANLSGVTFTGNLLDISDTLAHIASDSQALATLIGEGAIGTISPTDANTFTLSAAQAAALEPIFSHFDGGTQLIVADTAANITAHTAALTTLYNAGDLFSVTVSGASLADIQTNEDALNAVHAAVSASVSAADVQNHLGAFAALNTLTSISLTGGGTPTLTYGVGDLGNYLSTLQTIQTPHNINVSDSAVYIANDLLEGDNSVLSANIGTLHQISVSDGNPVSLTQTEVLAGDAVSTAIANVLDSSKFVSGAEVTGVDLTDVSSVQGVITCPITWAISDTASNIQTDLAGYGVNSTLQSLTQGTNTLASITVTGGGTITLHAAIAEAAGMDDSSTSLIAKLSGASFAVDQAKVQDLAILGGAGTYVKPASISVSDHAQNIATDLNSGAQNSALLANRTTLSTVAVDDNGTVALTAATALAAHVDDGAGSVVAKLSGAYTLEVTGVAVSQVTQVLNLPVPPTEITISDTAANIAADSDGAGLLAMHSGMIQSVTLSQGGTVNAAELTAMHGLPSFSANGNALVLQDGAAAIAGLAGNVLGLAGSVHVVDSGSAIGANIDGLESALSGYGGTLSLAATGTVNVSTTQYTNDLTVLHHITGSGVVTVTDTAAALAGLATTLDGDAKVGATALSADATNISAGTLLTLAGLTGFSLNGHTISVSDGVSALLADGMAVAMSTYGQNVTINDDAGTILSNLDALQSTFADYTGTLSIDMTGGGITVTAEQYAEDSKIIDSITQNGLVTVTGDAGSLYGLATMLDADAKVGATSLSGNATSISASTLLTLAGLTSFSLNNHTISVNDSASNILGGGVSAAITSYVNSVTITDSSGNIQSHLDALQTEFATYAGTLSVNMSGSGFTVSTATFDNDRKIIDSLQQNGKVIVSDTAASLVADAAAINADAKVASTTLSADAQVSASQLSTLFGLKGFSVNAHQLNLRDTESGLLTLTTPKLNLATSVTVSDSASGVGANAASLATLLAGYTHGATPTISLTDDAPVSASVAAGLAPVVSYLASNTLLEVSASPTEVQANLAGLEALGSKLGTITLTTTTMSAATAAAIQPLDGHLGNGVTLTVTGSASDINSHISALNQLNTDGHLATIQVQNLSLQDLATYKSEFDALPHQLAIADTAANIAADLTGGSSLLTAETAHLASVTLTAGGTVSAAQLADMAALPAFALGGNQLTVADQAANLLALTNPQLGFAHAVQVQDTSSDVAAHIDALEGKFAATANFSILASGSNWVVDINATQFANDQTVLDTITATHAVRITDTAAALAAIASTINADSVVWVTQLSQGATVGAGTLSTLSTLQGFSENSFSLTLSDNGTNVLGLSQSALNLAGNVQITDGSAYIGAHLGAISALSGDAGTLSITLNDGSPAISVAASSFAADAVAIGAITNTGVVSVSGSAQLVAGLANTLANMASIGSVTVNDSAADIAAYLPALETIAGANKLTVTLTDSNPITANLVTPLLSLGSAVSGGVAVADTPAQIAALAESSTQAVTYLNTYGASLSASGPVGVNDVAVLEALTSFSFNGHTVAIWDTASHLAAANSNVFTNANVSGVYLKTGGSATITAATAATLLGISGFSTNNPPGQSGSNAVTISDTAAHISAVYNMLHGNTSGFTGGVKVSSSATVADSVLANLQALHATALNGTVSLIVRDTAGNIAASAVAQAASAYIKPSQWQVSGNATISEAQAAILGGLSGINVGGYTLTLSLGSNTAISLADATNLGNIASSLNLGGYELLVSGSAAQLGALSNAALGLVTPQLTDTFANILGVSNALLLKGSVAVNDSEIISTTQAANFLNMLTTEGGHINPGSLSFANGNVETISGQISNLVSLQQSAAWTGNSGVHAGFHLVAADTVANLINPSNTSALHAFTGSTLLASQTTDAASAESLALLESTINFSLGGKVLTVSDTAANLLNQSYADGLAIAGVVQLSGADTVSAAGAEQLLGISNFTLNQSLTISDSSANLLDGVLAGDISGLSTYVHVQLAGTETLDAQTAASLVSLTNFTDPNGYLNIADSSSYLLASANLTAEQIASSVTLAGDETVSANTVLRLSELPHFTVGDNQLTLASNDYADAATLKAIADLGSHFNADGHTVTVTAETLDLTPSELSALQNDTIAQGGHVVAAISDASNTLTISGLGIAGDAIKIYDHTGSLIGSTNINAGSFTVTAADAGMSHNFAVTDVSGSTESAPVVVLDAAGLETAVSSAGASFASFGQIEVDTGKYLNIYLSTAQLPAAPALVYNANTHVISLDIPNQAPVALVTLGGSTLPSSLTAAEIFIKHHS